VDGLGFPVGDDYFLSAKSDVEQLIMQIHYTINFIDFIICPCYYVANVIDVKVSERKLNPRGGNKDE
jgi:hypothetical protein